MNKKEVKFVPFCFGRFGNRDCRWAFCNDYKKCSECYWDWWFLNKDRWTNIEEIIKEHLKLNNLKRKEFQNVKMSKM